MRGSHKRISELQYQSLSSSQKSVTLDIDEPERSASQLSESSLFDTASYAPARVVIEAKSAKRDKRASRNSESFATIEEHHSESDRSSSKQPSHVALEDIDSSTFASHSSGDSDSFIEAQRSKSLPQHRNSHTGPVPQSPLRVSHSASDTCDSGLLELDSISISTASLKLADEPSNPKPSRSRIASDDIQHKPTPLKPPTVHVEQPLQRGRDSPKVSLLKAEEPLLDRARLSPGPGVHSTRRGSNTETRSFVVSRHTFLTRSQPRRPMPPSLSSLPFRLQSPQRQQRSRSLTPSHSSLMLHSPLHSALNYSSATSSQLPCRQRQQPFASQVT